MFPLNFSIISSPPRYIQKLKPDVRYLSDWEKELTATPQNTRVEPSRVQVSNWINNAPVKQDMVVDALWNLRNFMIKNTLNLTNLSWALNHFIRILLLYVISHIRIHLFSF